MSLLQKVTSLLFHGISEKHNHLQGIENANKKHPQFTELHENLGGNYVDILNKQLNINIQELIKNIAYTTYLLRK